MPGFIEIAVSKFARVYSYTHRTGLKQPQHNRADKAESGPNMAASMI
jgi:hypothetical protein